MNMKKILAFMLCLLVAVCSACGKEQKNTISFEGYKGASDAVMTINGEDVSVDEYKYFLIMASYDLKNKYNVADEELEGFWDKTDGESGKTYAELAIEDAIDRCTTFHVYRTEAIAQGIMLAEEDKQLISQQANSMVEDYGEYMNILQLKAGGLTPDVHENITEMSYYSNLLFSDFVGNFRTITDKDIENCYKNNYIRAKHILVMTIDPETELPLSDEDKNAALVKVSQAYGKLENGADFDEVMHEYSEDTGLSSYPDGYTFAEDAEYDEAFKKTAFSLKEGEVSEIIEMSYGYSIIKREPLLENYPEENFEPISDKLMRLEFADYLEKCEEKAEIIGNKPVFDTIDVYAVLYEYLSQYNETLELIKQEFMRLESEE